MTMGYPVKGEGHVWHTWHGVFGSRQGRVFIKLTSKSSPTLTRMHITVAVAAPSDARPVGSKV